MIDETLEELQTGITKAQDALRRELAKIRTGRANPDIFDNLKADYYGSATPLKQMATITVPEPRMLYLKPFDKTAMKAIERAIMESSLGLNPSSDGDIIRVPLPLLTEERRKQLVKQARKCGEDCKIAIRKARHDAKGIIEALKKDGDAPEDDCERAMKKVEEIVKSGGGSVDGIVEKKEADITEI